MVERAKSCDQLVTFCFEFAPIFSERWTRSLRIVTPTLFSELTVDYRDAPPPGLTDSARDRIPRPHRRLDLNEFADLTCQLSRRRSFESKDQVHAPKTIPSGIWYLI